MFQNPIVHLIFFLGDISDKITLSGVHFSLHHGVELELSRENPEHNYKVPCGHLIQPTLPNTSRVGCPRAQLASSLTNTNPAH